MSDVGLALAGVVVAAVVAAVVFAMRVGGRRASESAHHISGLLQRSEARFHAMVRDSSDVMAIVDRQGRFSYVSPAADRVLGYDPASMVGAAVPRCARPRSGSAARSSTPRSAWHSRRWKDGSSE